MNNAGILGSGDDAVALNVSGDLNNSGLIYAKKSATLSLDGDFTSGGALNAVSEQDFNSFDLDLRGKEGDKSKQKNKFRQQSTEVTTNKTTIE
ncbi:hypothetical protein, partial [Bartonella acomydis]|uniref:hypothetical protein n=1 Tax=Bartonella acomydis TaxID=686234 RepID=UPI0031F062BC